jgi:hypothetical protein
MPRLRTRLLDPSSKRRDDHEVVALIMELPKSAAVRCRVFTAGLLDEAGQLYREVRLYGEYEALQFAARMNACGFVRVQPGPAPSGEAYESVFAKPWASRQSKGAAQADVGCLKSESGIRPWSPSS